MCQEILRPRIKLSNLPGSSPISHGIFIFDLYLFVLVINLIPFIQYNVHTLLALAISSFLL